MHSIHLIFILLTIPLVQPIASASSDRVLETRIRYAADINPKALWDGRTEVEFRAANYPRMVRAADARFMIDEEYVLGISQNGESRAYPMRFASWHHVINDRIGLKDKGGEAPISVTYCIVCNSGIRFNVPLINGRPMKFEFFGLYNGVMAMYDTATKSVWLQVQGRAIRGPMLEKTLVRGPVLDTTWGQWKKLHPNTLVMAPDSSVADSYESKGSIMVRGYQEFPTPYFKPTLTHRDSRLPMFESVLAVSVTAADEHTEPARPHKHYRAYPMKEFKGRSGVVNEVIAGTPVSVLFQGGTETLSAISPIIDDRVLTLEARGTGKQTAFYDLETGTRWSVEGLGEAGPLAGRQMARVESHMSQWYGWVSYFPETTIYGQDAKKPLSARK